MDKTNVSRRDFLKGTAAVSAGILATGLARNHAYAAGGTSETLKIGFIGCGGQGGGDLRNCLEGNPNAVLWAAGDLWEAKVSLQKGRFDPNKKDDKNAGRYKLEDRRFFGFDAYKKVIDSGVDMVILTTPPGFRPDHFAYAIEKGKHVFMEKPVCVDPVGYRKCIAAAEMATTKKLSVVAGTQRRHTPSYIENMKMIHDGAIGDIVAGFCYWIGGPADPKGPYGDKRPDGCSDIEWQCNVWYRYTWTCGDHIVEQHVHNIDIINWALNAIPVKCIAMGGRQTRTTDGNIFDHFAVEFEYPNGVRVTSYCSQFTGKPSTRVGEHVVGTKGTSSCSGSIKGEKTWGFDGKGKDNNGGMLEQIDWGKSITGKGPYFNEGKNVADSSMAAVLGRMSAYCGRELSWDRVVKMSKLDLMPPKLEFGPFTPPPVGKPGDEQLFNLFIGAEGTEKKV
jgi:predicted dehydrogenase